MYMSHFTNQPDPKPDPQTASSLRAPSQTQTDCFLASCLVSAASSSSFPSPQWRMWFEGPASQCNENYGGEWLPWTGPRLDDPIYFTCMLFVRIRAVEVVRNKLEEAGVKSHVMFSF